MNRTRATRPLATPSLVVALVLLFALTLWRCALVNGLPDQGFFAKYTGLAHDVLGGHVPVERLSDVSLGYLWIVVALTGPLGAEPMTIRTLQIVLVSVAALLCGIGAWRRWGPSAGFGAGAALLASRGALVNATEIEPETLILVLTAAGLALVLAQPRPVMRTLAGVAFGLAVVTRPSVLLPVVLLGVALGWTDRTRRGGLAAALGAGLLVPIVTAQLTIAFVTGGDAPPMNPGTVFAEGWNPLTSGYLGEAPAVVKDIEATLGLPDGLHVAYRLVAARAEGINPSPRQANRFWGSRGAAYIRRSPVGAMRLALRKAMFGLHSHNAWDLLTMVRKSAALRNGPFLPFGFLLALAVAGIGRDRRLALALWIAGGSAVMVLFYVSARQRNVVLPAVAVLAGAGVDRMVRWWRAGRRRAVAGLALAVVAAGTILTIDGPAQREDLHTWRLADVRRLAAVEVAQARTPDARLTGLVRGATALDPTALFAAPADAVAARVRAELSAVRPASRRFDLALVFETLGRFADAERLLLALSDEGYRPYRGARHCSSLAYHLAVCSLATGDFSTGERRLAEAQRDAGDDPRILALARVLAERRSDDRTADALLQRLEALYDPFTAAAALAAAHDLAGDSARALALRADLVRRLPEWDPAILR